MKRAIVPALGAAMLVLAGCQKACPPAPPPPPSAEGLPGFVNTAWVATSAGKRGSILVFLPDKTVVIDSCGGGFLVSQWGIISDNRIRVAEGAVPTEYEYSQSGAEVLELKPVGSNEPDTYVRAVVPYKCPEGSK
ncbi:MAG TPA: hypothetical protein VFS24_16665 [Steroidobacteraceae bacterium]|nr:hypothetical protein [Steroidobacteraceae bacterium]